MLILWACHLGIALLLPCFWLHLLLALLLKYIVRGSSLHQLPVPTKVSLGRHHPLEILGTVFEVAICQIGRVADPHLVPYLWEVDPVESRWLFDVRPPDSWLLRILR